MNHSIKKILKNGEIMPEFAMLCPSPLSNIRLGELFGSHEVVVRPRIGIPGPKERQMLGWWKPKITTFDGWHTYRIHVWYIY